MRMRLSGALLMTAVFGSPGWAQLPAPAGATLVFQDDFADLSNWVAEGPHRVEVADHRLHVRTADDERKVGQYIWCRQALPDDFRLEFEVTPASPSGFFLIFFDVQGTGGEDILAAELFENYMNWRTWKPYEDWDKYTSPPKRAAHHDGRIRGYHISYRRNEQANCNLRKNPGLELKKSAEVDALLPANETAHVALTRQGGHITLDVNGQRFMNWTDEEAPHRGGRFGFRNVYESDAYYGNVRLYELAGAEGGS